MNEAIEKLAKYLTLEAERGYDNGAVVGGLERMLEPWRGEAEQSGVSADLIEFVVARLQDYPRLSPNSREDTLRGLRNRLATEYPDPEESIPDELAPEQPAAEAVDASGTDESIRSAGPIAVGDSPGSEPEEKVAKPEPSPDTEDLEPVSLEAPLTSVPGIGPKSAKTLRKLGLETLGDLLWHLPRRYDDYSQLKTINRLEIGEEVTIIGTVEQIEVRTVRGGKLKLVEATVSDGTGSLNITWFNQTWIATRLKPGEAVVLSGEIEQYLGRPTMNGPEWEPLEQKQVHTNRIVPVYPLTAGITAKWLRRVINSVVSTLAFRVPDPLPESMLSGADLMPYDVALQQVHFPDSWSQLERAQHRLAFNEMLYLQLGVMRQKRGWHELDTEPISVDDAWTEQFLSSLPYDLTSAQNKAIKDIRADLESPHPMNRLLQGDVGSGKTVIAAAAIGMAASQGVQSALMAPTSILAEQHFSTLLELLPVAAQIQPEQIRLLLGSTPAAEKIEISEGLGAGNISLVIGTHALLQEPVTFARLGLTIIDEQHRFGVSQRAALRSKGTNPNLIVMTATPIPRSLALTLYGDLDLTVIDEFPPGRLPIQTQLFRPIERARAHTFVRGQLDSGHQAFIIYPLVEGSEKVQAKAAVDEHEHLQESAFPEYKLGLLHGRLKSDEKERVMQAFRSGEYDVLVSTAVVEVGVDVPNATVILIEGADRFGLSQLHQFRGRVGRREHQSYCLLIPTSDLESENERLKAMEVTADGFELAEMDLNQRGPGDFLGTRQSGFLELRAARITDIRMIEMARREAGRLFDQDPMLEAPEHQALAVAVSQFWTNGKGEIS